jgi:mannosyltransferase OCH1-like enzyme
MINSFNLENTIKIPKIIIQTWKTHKIPPIMEQLSNKLKYFNQDFDYKFYTDEDINDFIKKEYPEYYTFFNNFEYTIQKIDFFRYLVIYHYGGFYFDMDMDIDTSIGPLCEYECVFPKEYNEQNINNKTNHNLNLSLYLGNYAFGASPKNPFLKLCLNNIYIQRINKSDIPNNNDRFKPYIKHTFSHMKKAQSYIDHVLFTTGPILVSQSYEDYTRKEDINIIEPTPFKKYAFGNYGTHLAVGTWKHIETIENPKTIETIENYIKDYKPIETQRNNILFSCTTYLKSETHFEILQISLDTFIHYNSTDLSLINEFLIIMEYTEGNAIYKEKLEKKYPLFTFINKDESQKGQAKSLNIILDRLINYTYWLHWEDSWYSTGPVLRKTYDTIDNTIDNTNINHIQLTKKEHLYDMPIVNNDHIECKIVDDYKILKANNYLLNLWKNWEINDIDWSVWKKNGWWPFFSLTPSMNKVSVILKVGYFSTDEDKWPFHFEFEWALKWIRLNNIVLGIPKEINVIRDTHTPTYTTQNYNKWLKKLENKENKENYNRNVPYYTLKSDKGKVIIFWNPNCACVLLKKLIYFIEEGLKYNGDDITNYMGKGNFNKYFVEINHETLNRFNSYNKLLVVDTNSDITIDPDWIDEIIHVDDLTKLFDRYSF